jgi:hypothetical protein
MGWKMKSQRILPVQKNKPDDLVYLQSKYLIGWPGYRNARGRSGLGYVETQAEWAHMRGRIFSMLLAGKVLTRNPIFLIGMLVVGTISALPLILGVPDILAGGNTGWYVLIIGFPNWIFGLLLLRNVFISLFGRQGENDNDENNAEEIIS